MNGVCPIRPAVRIRGRIGRQERADLALRGQPGVGLMLWRKYPSPMTGISSRGGPLSA